MIAPASIQYLAKSQRFFMGCFARKISRCHSQTLKNIKPVENETAAVDKRDGETERDLKQVTKRFHLYKAEKGSAHLKKPLVLLFQWLYAKPSAVSKYCDLYHDIGLDVLAVRGKLLDFLWPPQASKLTTDLFKYLKSNHPDDQKFIVHAFSVGAYNYTVAMQTALEKQKETGHFRDKVIGQIFDSIVIGTYENMSHGIAQVLPNNRYIRAVVHNTLELYYNMTHETTTATYDKLVNHFKTEPIQVPTLMIYAENDPMCDVAVMESMLEDWRSRQPEFDVRKLSWPESKHAAHLREHQEDYMVEWKALMGKLKLL